MLIGVVAAAGKAAADPAPFDLAGPALSVQVIHADKALPISQAPNLSPGDRLWIQPDLPRGQSVRYLMVVAFLRGATNPPPEKWFHAWRTWDRKAGDALSLVVPDGAQQVLVFLAPQTGGDFSSLVKAVRSRPGAFVRASQDLNQASLDRTRLDAFVAAVRRISDTDPARLKTVSPLLARSLDIKLDAECLQKVEEAQAPCLTRGQESLVLGDGQSQSMVQALTSGDTANLIQQLSTTPQAGYGYFSPYIASVMDIARILDSFHSAQYQYIPALASAHGEQISLLLNVPPSFKPPMSVLVVALPAIAPPQPPPLHPVDPKAAYCLAQANLALPAEGAPLVFSTGYAHDLVLRLKRSAGPDIDLPVKADAEKGGLVVDASSLGQAGVADATQASIQGVWGFSAFSGPTFPLQSPSSVHWRLAARDQQPLVAGRDNPVTLEAPAAACVESVVLKSADGATEPVVWKAAGPDKVEAVLSLKGVRPGPLALLVKQYGRGAADEVQFQAFPQPADLDSFVFHAGDHKGVLKGRRLAEVTGLRFGAVAFKPDGLATGGPGEELSLVASDDTAAAKLEPGVQSAAKVSLKDGRTVQLQASIEPARPSVALISRTIAPSPTRSPLSFEFTDKDEWPADVGLTFSIRAQTPNEFTGTEKIEVANDKGVVLAGLTAGAELTQQDPHVFVAQIPSGKALGPTAFGPLQFRVVEAGVAGDWQPLAHLVRAPALGGFQCPDKADENCLLNGSDLFLIDSLSANPDFDKAVKAPDGFTGQNLPAPHPSGLRLYVKLRDDPSVINWIALPPAAPPARPSAADGEAHGRGGSDPRTEIGPGKPAPSPAKAPSSRPLNRS